MVLKKSPRKPESQNTEEISQNDVIELYVWGGGWGLPSVDTESLLALALTRFGGAPAKVIECNNPWKSPNGTLPFFKHGKKIFFNSTDLGNHLRAQNYSCDYGLNSRECADVIAYQEYIIEAMTPALQYFFWIHNQNFNNDIRPFFGTRLPWLYKMWYPNRLQKKALEVITTVFPDAESNMQLCEEYILEKAGACIQLLSNKLGNKEFFVLQNSPSTLDGLVFAHLAPFLKIKLSSNPIREFILGYPNLEKFLSRISLRYLSSGAQGDVDQSKSRSSSSSLGPHGDSFFSSSDNSTARKIFAGLVASAVMAFYAYRIGMIGTNSITYEDEDEEDDEDYY